MITPIQNRILFYSVLSDASPIAFHIQQFEDCEVWIYYNNPKQRNLLKGYVNTVNSLQEGLAKKPDLVIFDFTGFGKLAAELQKKGIKVIGAAPICDEIEANRKFGLQIMQMTGIKVPESKEFNSLEEVQKEVIATNKRYVLKPESLAAAPETTYIAETAEEMCRYVEYLKQLPKDFTGEKFILQEFVEGIELSTEMWFSQGKPIYPANSTFEEKRRDPLYLGPVTGCATSTVFCYKQKEPKIVQKVFKKLFLLMDKVKYTGPLDINCIITEKGDIYGLEWTPRFGYNALYCFLELLKISISEFFYKLAEGSLTTIPVKDEFSFGIKLHTSPFPTDLGNIKRDILQKQIYDSKHGLPVIWRNEDLTHIWPEDVEKSKDGPIVSGFDLVICEVTNTGKSIQKAYNKTIEIFDNILVPNKSGRVADGCERAIREYPKLQKLGFL